MDDGDGNQTNNPLLLLKFRGNFSARRRRYLRM